MFIHNLNPVLLDIGFVQIRYYGLVYAVGFLLTLWLLLRAAKNKRIKNLTEDASYDIMLYFMLGVIIGARLFEGLFYNYALFYPNPLEFFMVWHGGMSFHGGLLGGLLAIYLTTRKHKVGFYKITDLLAPLSALMLVFGRIANFINAELVGTITTVPWAVKFPGYEGYRHPSQLYEALKNLLIFGMLIGMKRSFKKMKEGTLTWAFIGLYGLLRFIVNFWREQEQYVFGIGTGQWLSLAMVPVAVFMLWKIYRK